MGFFDGLFGVKERERVPLSGLDLWVRERINAESGRMLEDARPILESISEVVTVVRNDLGALDAAGYNEINPKYDKIVRTAKPAYVRSMRLALEGLGYMEFGLAEYDRRLSAALDAMGKAGFGDGKFLPYAFPDEVRRVQVGCRRLLDARERLAVILKGGAEAASLDRLLLLNTEYLNLVAAADKLRGDVSALRDSSGDARGRIEAMEASLAKLRCSADYEWVSGLRMEFAALESDIESSRSRVHAVVSPLKSALRKYGKMAYDPGQTKLAKALEDDPSGAFYGAGVGEVGGLLDSLERACLTNAIRLKDPGKTLKNIESARDSLSDEHRIGLQAKDAACGELKRKVESSTALSEECKILGELEAAKQAADKYDRDVERTLEKIRQLGEKAKEKAGEIAGQLEAMGYELEK